MIIIEKDTPLPKAEIDRRLRLLEDVCDAGDDDAMRAVLKQVIPTYRSPEEVNANAEQAKEMKMRKESAMV